MCHVPLMLVNNVITDEKFIMKHHVEWPTPKLFDGFNCESKGENSGKKKSWGVLPGSYHFNNRRACWSSEMRLGKLTSNSITHPTYIN